MGPLALVTGATGFVGSHLVEALLGRGYRVRCLLRASSDRSRLPRERIEIVEGAVDLPDTLGPAVRDVDFVFHSAGVVRTGVSGDYERVNVEGTRNLTVAAARGSPGVRRFVQVSSLAAGGASAPGRPRSEDDPDAPVNDYGRSKLRAEEALIAAAEGVPWTILRPPAVYGPRDRAFLLLARLAARGWTIRVGGRPQPAQVIHVRDLARGLVEAASSPQAVGRRYYLAHPELTGWTVMGALMARSLGRPPRVLVVPRRCVPWVGRFAGAGARAMGKPNPLPLDRLRDLLAPAWTCDTSRAEAEWGFRAEIDLRTGIEETMTWYRSEGWV